MLKIHSFLHRIKLPISKLLPFRIRKYKTSMAVIAYMMITVLFILSPDYIYGASNEFVEPYAKAKTIQSMIGTVEETANEAIIRTAQYNVVSKEDIKHPFILKSLITDNMQMKSEANFFGEAAARVDSSSISIIKTNTEIDTVETNEQEINKQEINLQETKEPETIVKEKKEQKTKDSENSKAPDKEESKKDTEQSEKDTEKSETQNKEQKVIDLSKEDIEILQRIVEAEATGEDIKGKILVANVILNRVNNQDFPDTIEGVVFQKDGGTYQFSPIKDGRYWSVSVTKDTKAAIERVMQGEDYSQGALFFSARSKANKNSMRWFDSNLVFLFEYGGHEFFKD